MMGHDFDSLINMKNNFFKPFIGRLGPPLKKQKHPSVLNTTLIAPGGPSWF